MKKLKVIGVIPARYQSSRFPGKPLALIAGKPMIYHVWNQAKKALLLDQLLVATDDKQIQNVCARLDIQVVMTSEKHETGTDRVAEVAQKVKGDIFVNIQGDEPLIDPRSIEAVTESILSTEVWVTNAYSLIRDRETAASVNVVKVVTDINDYALAFSRSLIPHSKDPHQIYKKQLGLYAFTREAIAQFPHLKRQALEITESVDMYRFLEHGYKIKMVPVPDEFSVAVDQLEDIQKVEDILKFRVADLK